MFVIELQKKFIGFSNLRSVTWSSLIMKYVYMCRKQSAGHDCIVVVPRPLPSPHSMGYQPTRVKYLYSYPSLAIAVKTVRQHNLKNYIQYTHSKTCIKSYSHTADALSLSLYLAHTHTRSCTTTLQLFITNNHHWIFHHAIHWVSFGKGASVGCRDVSILLQVSDEDDNDDNTKEEDQNSNRNWNITIRESINPKAAVPVDLFFSIVLTKEKY